MTLSALDDMTRTHQEWMLNLRLRRRRRFSVMELWWQTSRIIIPLFKSYFIQWTSSNICLHFWRRNWKMLSVEKLKVQLTYHFLWLQARAWWGILERILLWASIILFCISQMYFLSCLNFSGRPLYHSSECKNDCDSASLIRINLTESKATTTKKDILNKMNAEQEMTYYALIQK